MPPLYESARNDSIMADKYRQEAADGLRDVLHADAQLLRGEIGLGETLSREGAGFARAVNGTLGCIFRSGMAEAEGSPYGGVLPAIEISEGQQSQSQSMDSEAGLIRQMKKEKASYLDSQQDEMDPKGDMIRLMKKEKASCMENQQDQSGSEGGLIRQMKKEKANYLESQSV